MKLRTTLDQWLVLKTVVQQGGFAQAAEYLNRSQSTVSYAVSQLQSQLGVKLLETKGRRAVLTSIGKILFHRASVLLESAKSLETIAKSTNEDWPAEITVVVDDPFPRELLAIALKQFEQYTATRVQIYEVSLSGAVEAVEKGMADIVIAFQMPKGHLEFADTQIVQVIVAHVSHPLHQLSFKPTVEDLANHLQLVVRDSGLKSTVDMGWLEARHRWTVASSQLSVNLLRQGIGFAWLPFNYIYNEKDLKPVPLEISQIRRFFLKHYFAKKTTPNKGAIAFGECLKSVLLEYHDSLDERLMQYLRSYD